MDDTHQFNAILEKFDSRLWAYHIRVPASVAEVFYAQGTKRVLCTLNGKVEFQCAILPKGEGVYFININKKLRDQLGLQTGNTVEAALCKDTSEYGLPMPAELDELFRQDEEASAFFQALTPGKQRSLLYLVGTVKNSNLRIHRAILVAEHLKGNAGKIDYKQLYAELKSKP